MIGILLIATGRYITYFNSLYNSMEKNFLPGLPKTYYLFTDTKNHSYVKKSNLKIYSITRKGHPGDTLYRYSHFLSIKDELIANTDILYYSDVDMDIVDKVESEILPDEDHDYVFVQHCNAAYESIENRTESTAYIPSNEFKRYVAGGFQGGKTKNYLQMCEEINNNIIKDDQRGIIAKWHDESHLNRFMHSNFSNVKFLTSSYCYPGGSARSYPRKIVALDKDHALMRSDPIYYSIIGLQTKDEENIDKFIQSVINQTYPFWELILGVKSENNNIELSPNIKLKVCSNIENLTREAQYSNKLILNDLNIFDLRYLESK